MIGFLHICFVIAGLQQRNQVMVKHKVVHAKLKEFDKSQKCDHNLASDIQLWYRTGGIDLLKMKFEYLWPAVTFGKERSYLLLAQSTWFTQSL